MNVKIDIDKKTDDRRLILWRKFGKVVSRQIEFMKKFDARAYMLGLDVIEGTHQPKWIDIEKQRPKPGQKCFVETNVCVTWGIYTTNGNGGFYIEENQSDFAENIEEAFQWCPYPTDFK